MSENTPAIINFEAAAKAIAEANLNNYNPAVTSFQETRQETPLGTNLQKTVAHDIASIDFQTNGFRVESTTKVFSVDKESKEEKEIFNSSQTTHFAGKSFQEIVESVDNNLLDPEFIGTLTFSHFLFDR